MKKMIIAKETENREFAFVRGNRPTNEKVIRAKMKSIHDHGQLSPITVAYGEKVIELGGHLVDLKGQEISDEQSKNYYAVLDGQHRLIAYLNLKLNLDDLVIAEPLNAELSIAELIAQMNICTTTWKGADYMAAPAMMLSKSNEVFDFAMYLRSNGFPLATISQWCLGTNSLKAKDLAACVKTKELPKAFEDAGWFYRSIRWYKAAQGKFKNEFLAKKYLIFHIISKYNNAADPNAFTAQIEDKLNQLTREQADEIMNPHKEEGQTREQATLDMLNLYLG